MSGNVSVLLDDENAIRDSTSTSSAAATARWSAGALLSTTSILNPAIGTSSSIATPVNLRAIAMGSGTGTGGFNETSLRDIVKSFGVDVPPVATAAAIRRLHTISGLTWEELARLFGVSRRAVHAWATGSRMNATHAARLSTLASAFASLDTGESKKTRARLMDPTASGQSEYELLRASLLRPVPVHGVISLAESLGSQADEPASHTQVVAVDYVD